MIMIIYIYIYIYIDKANTVAIQEISLGGLEFVHRTVQVYYMTCYYIMMYIYNDNNYYY